MAIDNYYNRARELQAWALNMAPHVYDHHTAHWYVNFHLEQIFYASELRYINGTADSLSYRAMNGRTETDIVGERFWAALDQFLNSYEYAVAYNYDQNNLNEAIETVGLGEDNVLEFKAAHRPHPDQKGERLHVRLRFFKTKKDALVWAMQPSNPEVVARDGATLGPTFYWWRPM